MKKTIRITVNELKQLFYSPIAWIILVIFFYMTSTDYFEAGSIFTGSYERGGGGLEMCENLTNGLTVGFPFGFVPKVISNLFIFFPLITMGLISRETSSGTIKLLYSSPVKIRQIVFGKFLAMQVFSLVLLAVIILIYVHLSMVVVKPDYWLLLSTLFALGLVLATYSAIGIFISSLTTYQVVAAVITVTVFVLMDKIGDFWQEVAFVRDVTYYMQVSSKSSTILSGVYNLRDVCYYLILIGAFLSFTVLRLRASVEYISPGRKWMRALTVVGVAFVLGWITSNPHVNAYVDITRDSRLTITPRTQKLLAELNDGPLEVTVVGNLFEDFYRVGPAQQNSLISTVWEPYIRFKPDIHVNFIYYYGMDSSSWRYKINRGKPLDSIAESERKTYKMPMSLFMKPSEISKLVNVRAEEYRSFFILRYKDRQAILRVYADLRFWPSEDEITAAIKQLTVDVPRIVFLSDEQERNVFLSRQKDYRTITSQLSNRYSLINQGHKFDTMSLRDRDIPKGISALAIADPRVAFERESFEKISRYIDSGGNLFVAAEYDRKEIIQPLLDKLGLTLRKELLLQSNSSNSSDMVYGYLTPAAKNLSPQFNRIISNEARYYGDTSFRVAMPGVSAIDVRDAGFTVTPLLYTAAGMAWNRTTSISQDSLQLRLRKSPGDESGPFVTALKLERAILGRQQRIIVTGDADFPTSAAMMNNDFKAPKRYNYQLAFWCFSQFGYGQYPANTLKPLAKDNAVKVSTQRFSDAKVYYYFLFPGLLVAAAFIVLIRRKRK